MTSLNKTIEIPADRHLIIELTLPDELPPGPAEMTLTINPTRTMSQLEPLSKLFGSLKDSKTFTGDSAALVRGLRDEW